MKPIYFHSQRSSSLALYKEFRHFDPCGQDIAKLCDLDIDIKFLNQIDFGHSTKISIGSTTFKS